MCSNPALSDKKQYPTFARTYSDWTPALIKVLKDFKWNSVILIYSQDNKFKATRDHMIQEFEKPANNISVPCEHEVVAEIDYKIPWGEKHYRPFMEKLSKMQGGSKYQNY